MTQHSRRYLSLLRDAHVMESQALEMLGRMSRELEAHPALRARIDHHARSVAGRRKALHQLVERADGWNRMIGLATPANANGSTWPQLYTSNEADSGLSGCHTFQHIKIATYLVLIAKADAAGDDEGIRVFQAGLSEECAMANWLRDRLIPPEGADAAKR